MNAHHHRLFFLWMCCVLFSLSACDTTNPATTSTSQTTAQDQPTPTIAVPKNRGITPTVATTTLPVPTTQSSCPAAGTARAMLLAPLALGRHQTVVYTLNEGTYDAPLDGKLLRYDVVKKQTNVILTIPKAHFYEVQVSTDGQWILFVAITGMTARQSELQMVRMDGQGLQTLYCSPDYSIQQTQWSYDQHSVVFYNVVNQQGVIYLLDMTNGTLRTALTTPSQVGLVIRTWLDATRLYVTDTSTDTLHSRIYVLDLGKGMQQNLSDMAFVVQRQYGDFDTSPDGTQLYLSYGGCPQDICNGPSSIGTQALANGQKDTIYDSQAYDVIQVRIADEHSLLFLIGNTGATNSDTTHNGLWKINTDGTGTIQLIPISIKQFAYFNYRTQDLWSNVSRDSSMYVLQVNGFKTNSSTEVDSLLLGSLQGGTPTAVATTNNGSQLAAVGWTMG